MYLVGVQPLIHRHPPLMPALANNSTHHTKLKHLSRDPMPASTFTKAMSSPQALLSLPMTNAHTRRQTTMLPPNTKEILLSYNYGHMRFPAITWRLLKDLRRRSGRQRGLRDYKMTLDFRRYRLDLAVSWLVVLST